MKYMGLVVQALLFPKPTSLVSCVSYSYPMGITFSTEIMGHNKALFCRTYRQPMLIHWGYGLFTTNSHHPFGMQGLCLIVYRQATAIPS